MAGDERGRKTGLVKSYNKKGFGFILSPGLGELYFSKDSIPQQLHTSDLAGESVTFEVRRFPNGKMLAMNLRPVGDVSTIAQGPRQPQGASLGAWGPGTAAGAGGCGLVSAWGPGGGGHWVPSGSFGRSGGYGPCGGCGPYGGGGFGPGSGGCCGPAGGFVPCKGSWGPGKGGGSAAGGGHAAGGFSDGPPPGSAAAGAAAPGCGLPGAGASGAATGGPAPGQPALRRDEWKCRACGAINYCKALAAGYFFPRGRIECNRCKAQKPFEEDPYSGSRAVRGALPPRSRSSRSSSSSSSRSKKRRRSKSKGKKKKKKKKKSRKKKSSSSSSAGSSSSSGPAKKKDSGRSRSKSGEPKVVAGNGGSESAAGVDKAKAEALEKLLKLKDIPEKDKRMVAWRALLREWHPDKNPDHVEVATAVFQFLQKGKQLLNDQA